MRHRRTQHGETSTTAEVVAFLSSSAAYSGKPRQVEVIQTHASYVFLAGSRAYKIKKPVNFGFLDFSTLAKRRQSCEREIEYNRRLAGDVYLRVLPIRRVGKSFVLGGEREKIVEYAVEMRRLRKNGFAHARLAAGRFGTPDVTRIVRLLAAFYRKERSRQTQPLPDRQQKSIYDNFAAIRRSVDDTTDRAVIRALYRYTRLYYRDHALRFRKRRQDRCILPCHGDLRLEHIHFDGSAIRIYDCIEFNETLRTIDIANDVAFLAMDFDYLGRPDLSRHFVDHISRAIADPDLVMMVDFYRCYRAAVRYKVETLRSQEPEVSRRERTLSADNASQFRALALRYATIGSRPTVVVVMGGVASGKSTLASTLAAAIGVDVVSSDVTRKRLASLRLDRRPGKTRRTTLYSEAMSKRVYDTLLRAARDAIGKHHSIVVDATFAKKSERTRLADLCQQTGADLLFLELMTSARERKARLAARGRLGRSISDARLEDFATLQARYESPGKLEPSALLRLRSRARPEDTFAAALLSLAKRHACQDN